MTNKNFIILLIIIPLLSNCYYVTQGYNLVNTYSKAKKIENIIKEKDIAQEEKKFFLLIQKIKNYSVNKIGLVNNKNYTKYISLNKNYLVDLVTACEKDSFNQYQWNYMVMGKMPYKGFFNIKKVKKEAEKLKNEYDVYIGKVDAFSTLGILKDPVFSFMQKYSVYELADTIFHEQTHATLFLKKHIDFNENLANFIGTEGALSFIIDTYGIDSDEYKNTLNLIKDSETFKKLMNDLYNELSLLYSKNISKNNKLKEKEKIINNWKKNFSKNYKSNFKTNAYQRIPEIELNNAYITIFRSYTKDLSIFYELYEYCDYDLKELIKIIKKLKKYKGDPINFIKNQMTKNIK
jgi:predicted aminopeptidase